MKRIHSAKSIKAIHLSNQLRQERADYQHGDAEEEDGDGAAGDAFPFFEDDAPDIAEDDVEGHEDTPAEGDEDGVVGEETFAEAEAEELAVPEEAGEGAEE